MPDDDKQPHKLKYTLSPIFGFLVCVAVFLAVTIIVNWE